MKTADQRRYLIEEKITTLRLAHPEASYDELWRTMSALPEMQPVLAAMEKPATATARTNDGDDEGAERRAASARFLGLVQTASHERGIGFDAAWNALRVEEADLFKKMGGGEQPLDRYPIYAPYPQPMAGRSVG